MASDPKDVEPKAGDSGANATPLAETPAATTIATTLEAPEFDEFGLPIKKFIAPPPSDAQPEETEDHAIDNTDISKEEQGTKHEIRKEEDSGAEAIVGSRDVHDSGSDSDDADFKDAPAVQPDNSAVSSPVKPSTKAVTETNEPLEPPEAGETPLQNEKTTQQSGSQSAELPPPKSVAETSNGKPEDKALDSLSKPEASQQPTTAAVGDPSEVAKAAHNRNVSTTSAANAAGISEFSHQHGGTVHQEEVEEQEEDEGWQEMPSYARYDMYDDDNRLIAREHHEEEDESYGYAGLGGAGKGYTRVVMDEDAESATSMDDHTKYLFKGPNGTSAADGDDEARDAVSQMQATKDLLTEGQRIAYVGVVRLEIANMVKEVDSLEMVKGSRKQVTMAAEAMKMWGQKMMIRLYAHMDISEAEQVMIEQLGEHGVIPQDLTPALLTNSRVHNPMAEEVKPASPPAGSPPPYPKEEAPAEMPPPYETLNGEDLPEVKTPSQLPTTEKIDIDLRWTVLCDLFLVLIADSIYDARSRVLLERVGQSIDISWIDICKFEKKVTDALEMQQAAEKENWNEDQHMEHRRKLALKKRYLLMGLATVGGGLVIGLSAGLLAPVIGAGLAAGFTTIGVTGTGSFLAGAGGAALITSGAAASGGFIGGKAANRRTGAVKTFEYRPLHNNKRVNLIVTVSGWLTGKVDDVRLPYSTVDSTMGDIYSVLWEPEMLRSMGDTINILATEALTQGLQQVLGSTILISLMAAIQLPVVLTKLSYLIDNPWAVSLDRATSAGLILADSLMERNLGTRPITLVGYSLGSRVIFSCLQELSKKGALGVVQNVYMFGSPIVVKKDEYLRARSVVSGRFVNGYNRSDWILGYLFRLTNGGIRRIAGLGPIEACPRIENMDVTELVPGHMEYRKAMPSLLMKCGWEVTSEEFSEIEDPDPENHGERQRELINEIEEARKELEREGKSKKGGKFAFFGRRKKGDREEWEIYEETNKNGGGTAQKSGNVEDNEGNNYGVLFDIDAIRAELAKEAQDTGEEELQIKEIKSTLPPMKLDFSPVTSPSASGGLAVSGPRDSLRVSKSAEVLPTRFSNENGSSRDLLSNTRDTFSSSISAYHYEPQDHDEEIQMTFDTSFDEPKHQHLTVDDGPSRPEIKSAQTLPNVTLSDPWNDPDDDDFGQEKEISMTFA